MKLPHGSLSYELPQDIETLAAYINKNESYSRSNAKRMKRALRKLKYA